MITKDQTRKKTSRLEAERMIRAMFEGTSALLSFRNNLLIQ